MSLWNDSSPLEFQNGTRQKNRNASSGIQLRSFREREREREREGRREGGVRREPQNALTYKRGKQTDRYQGSESPLQYPTETLPEEDLHLKNPRHAGPGLAQCPGSSVEAVHWNCRPLQVSMLMRSLTFNFAQVEGIRAYWTSTLLVLCLQYHYTFSFHLWGVHFCGLSGGNENSIFSHHGVFSHLGWD